MLLAKCSNSCAACKINCLQFCIAGAKTWAPNPLVILLRNAQTDLAIRIWTILVPIRLRRTEKTDLVDFRLSFRSRKSRPKETKTNKCHQYYVC